MPAYQMAMRKSSCTHRVKESEDAEVETLACASKVWAITLLSRDDKGLTRIACALQSVSCFVYHNLMQDTAASPTGTVSLSQTQYTQLLTSTAGFSCICLPFKQLPCIRLSAMSAVQRANGCVQKDAKHWHTKHLYA